MTTPISPVTENEMRDLMQRLASMIVGYSSQAKQLEDMQATVNSLNDRLQYQADENAKARKEINDTYDLIKGVEGERDQAKRDLSEAQTTLAAQQDVINARNTRIAELEAALSQSQSKAYDLDHALSKTQSDLTNAINNRDYWAGQSKNWEDQYQARSRDYQSLTGTNVELTSKVNSLQAKLDKIRSTIEDATKAASDPTF